MEQTSKRLQAERLYQGEHLAYNDIEIVTE